MRIIAGTKRGMHLLSPKTCDSRPITDRVKESLFSVLYGYDLPADAVVADLFSGVGSLGLEALSRGAEFVTFVEQDPKIAATLNQNIEKGLLYLCKYRLFGVGERDSCFFQGLGLPVADFRIRKGIHRYRGAPRPRSTELAT